MLYPFQHSNSLISSIMKLQLFLRSCPCVPRSPRGPQTRVGPSSTMLSCSRATTCCRRHPTIGCRSWSKPMTQAMKGSKKCCNGSGHPSTRRTTFGWCTNSSRVALFASGTRPSIFTPLSCCNTLTCQAPYGLTLRWTLSRDSLKWGGGEQIGDVNDR
jgi:hypothetical protein